MNECRDDECEPNDSWQDFLAFLWYQARLIFWCMSFYVVVQLVYSFTGRWI